MIVPSPEQYSDWKAWAAAVSAFLAELPLDPLLRQMATEVAAVTPGPSTGGNTGGNGELGTPPAGWSWAWWGADAAAFFLANPDYDPPIAADIVKIDTAGIANAAIEVSQLADSAVTGAKILNGVVTELKMAANSIATSAIKDLNVLNAKLGNATIQSAKIGNAQIITALVADATILSAKILDGTIATADIGNAQIVSTTIGDAAIVTAKIDDLAVNSSKIANLAVSSGKIANLSVGSGQIIDANIIRAKIGSAAVGTAEIGDLAVTNAKIADLAVTTAKIGDAAISNAKIGNVISSANWNETNKAGWHIDKTGLIRGQGIIIYDAAGNVAFASGTGVSWAMISGTGKPADFASANTWMSAFGPGGVTINANTVTVNSGGGGHDTGAQTTEAYEEGWTLEFKWNGVSGAVVGVMPHASTPSWGGFPYGFHVDSGNLAYRENGGAITGLGVAPNTTETYRIVSDGRRVQYFRSGSSSPLRTVTKTDTSARVKGFILGSGGGQGGTLAFHSGARAASFGVNTYDFGGFAGISQLTAANVGTYLAASAIGGTYIANAAITNALIANAAILSANIGDAQIINAKIGAAAVLSANIQDATIGTADIGDSQINSAKIGDASIATADIGNQQVANAQIADANIGTSKMGDASISTAKLGDAQVTTAKIADLAVDTLKIAGAAITVPSVTQGSDVFASTGFDTIILSTGYVSVGDGVDGNAFVQIYCTMDSGSQKDCGVRIYIDTDTGGGWVNRGYQDAGARSVGGDTYSKIPIGTAFAVDGASSIAVRIRAQPIAMPGASNAFSSTIRYPCIVIQGAKR